MQTINTQGIILSRTDFGEADRIIHFLTPDYGKISGIAKGVRKSKSRLAGGIELFSESELSFIVGKSEIYTLISARLIKHYDNIVKDLARTNTAYDFLRLINKSTEDNTGYEYFELLSKALKTLDENSLDPEITMLWFKAQLIKMSGHSPNLQADIAGQNLSKEKKYTFDFDSMHFNEPGAREGTYDANHIKFLRLCFGVTKPEMLHKIQGSKKLAASLLPLVNTLLTSFIKI
jgi:DNA repair protein RecO (recombination protein O)